MHHSATFRACSAVVHFGADQEIHGGDDERYAPDLPEFHPITPALKQSTKYQKATTPATISAAHTETFACTRSHLWSRALSHGARFIIHPLDSNLAVFGECLRCIKHHVYHDVKHFVYKSASEGASCLKTKKSPHEAGCIS
jgi:hypothetical protein